MPEIHLPLKIQKSEGAKFCHLVDATGRAICGGLDLEDAEWLVSALNAQPRKKSKKVQIEEQLKASDLTAQLAGRDDISYCPSDSLPGGEHILRFGAAKRRG